MLTVEELIKLLKRVEDKTKNVYTEGCDCYGEATDVTDFDGEESILIKRES